MDGKGFDDREYEMRYGHFILAEKEDRIQKVLLHHIQNETCQNQTLLKLSGNPSKTNSVL